MATIYLIHGGWHGGWCWDLVRPLLEAKGYTVRTPTLPGLAERASELTRETDLESHIADVVAVISADGASRVALVGHSYAGMVVTGVADRLPGRIGSLVYLDAAVPADGQSCYDVLPAPRREYLTRLSNSGGQGWKIPPPPPESFGVTHPALADWARALLTPQPMAALTQKIRLTGDEADVPPRTYIHCTQGSVVASFAPFAARFKDDAAWEVFEMATGHDAMLTEPHLTTDLIDRAASVV